MAEAEKKALVAQLALQRSEVALSRSSLKSELSVPKQVKKAFRRKPAPWIAGAVVTCLAVGLLFRRKKVIYSSAPLERGFIGRTSNAFLALARPALTSLALKHAKDYAEARFGSEEENSMLGGPPQK